MDDRTIGDKTYSLVQEEIEGECDGCAFAEKRGFGCPPCASEETGEEDGGIWKEVLIDIGALQAQKEGLEAKLAAVEENIKLARLEKIKEEYGIEIGSKVRMAGVTTGFVSEIKETMYPEKPWIKYVVVTSRGMKGKRETWAFARWEKI